LFYKQSHIGVDGIKQNFEFKRFAWGANASKKWRATWWQGL